MTIKEKFYSSFTVLEDLSDRLIHRNTLAPYSVLRANTSKPKEDAIEAVDFCVIWDEVFDSRLARLILKIQRAKLFRPIKYISSRQGTLTVVVSDDFFFNSTAKEYESFCSKMDRLANNVENDPWVATVGILDLPTDIDPRCTDLLRLDPILSLITEEPLDVYDFLIDIDIKWELGIKNGA